MIINITDISKYVKLEQLTYMNTNVVELYKQLINIKLPFDSFTMQIDILQDNGLKYFYANFKQLEENKFMVSTSVQTDRNNIYKNAIYTFKTTGENRMYFKETETGGLVVDVEQDVDGKRLSDADFQIAFESDSIHLYICMFALSLINCRNVTLEEIDPNTKLSRQVKRNMQRKNIPALEKYHVLKIEPMKTKKKTANSYNDSYTKVSFHVCRGHFKTYKGKGLFGKYKGTFWFPPHTKGSSEIGTVTKDYQVKAITQK